jgi:hypothetical protein
MHSIKLKYRNALCSDLPKNPSQLTDGRWLNTAEIKLIIKNTVIGVFRGFLMGLKHLINAIMKFLE